mmetsp:Transcript_21189/g.39838  ORF Transcript_21189/g.39838 Transcript_21189/m.39838 type:complete len:248 (-) Transcript_21189:21-764(-)
MAGLGSRRGPFHPGDLRPSGVRGPPLSLPPMGARPTKQAPETKARSRDKAHEERAVLESALAPAGPAQGAVAPQSARQRSALACSPCAESYQTVTTAPSEGPVEAGALQLRVLRQGVPQAEVRLEPSTRVQVLKAALAQQLGVRPEDQRLFWRSRCLQDGQSLHDSGLVAGEHDIVLIPELSHRATGVSPICARRGLNMVPSGPSVPWKPSKHSRIRHEDLGIYFGDAAPLPPMDIGLMLPKAIQLS